MKKEFKMKKTLALVMALSVAATAAANFSAFAVDERTAKTDLALTASTARYTLTIPTSISLKEKSVVESGTTKFYATNADNSPADKISVSDVVGLTDVAISLSASDVTVDEKAAVKNSTDESDKKAITVKLDSTELKLDSGSTKVSYGSTGGDKALSIETGKYDNPVTGNYTGSITFKATATAQ